MAQAKRYNVLLPWYIGLAIIVVVDAYVGYLFYATRCQATGLAQVLVLIVVPAVYLVLMYLTLKSSPER
jgi:hypothetical protein